MKRCNNCGHYAAGQPTYCPQCGRSYNVKICARGHANSRRAQFCPTCGSAEFSTPAPAESFLVHASQWGLRLIVVLAAGAMVGVVVLALIQAVSTDAVAGAIVALLFYLALLTWLMRFIPAPIKAVGRSAGRLVIKTIKGQRERH
jgi:hypothetical protein